MNRGIIAAAALALLVAGCSSGSSPKVGSAVTVTKTVTKTVAAAATPSSRASAAAKPAAHQASGTLAFGQTYTSSSGRTLTIGKPVPYVPSSVAAVGSTIKGAKFWKVQITARNGSGQAYDLSGLSLQVTSGSTANVDGVTDLDGNVGNDPQSSLLPGRTVTWFEAYPVVPGQHLTIEVDDLSSFSTLATWDGVVG